MLVGDITVSYGDAGSGPPLILLHGGGLTSGMWSQFAEAATNDGWRVLTPDTRNHGATDNPSGEFSYDLLARDLRAFITALGLEAPAIMGYSDGGVVVETFLLQYPSVASAAIISGATHRIAVDDRYRDGLETFYGARESGPLPAHALDALEARSPEFVARLRTLHATANEPERWRTLHQLAWPTWTTERIFSLDAFANVPVPTLVLLGEDDEFFSPSDALALANAFPNGELAVLPAGRHNVFRDRPDAFAAIVLDFLKRRTVR